MKRFAFVAGVALALTLLTAGIRTYSDFILMPSLTTSELPVGPRFTLAQAWNSTVGAPTFYTGSAWRNVVNTTAGQGPALESGTFVFDGGTRPFGITYASAPHCVCGNGLYDAGTSATAFDCQGSTTALTFRGSANSTVTYVCVGTR